MKYIFFLISTLIMGPATWAQYTQQRLDNSQAIKTDNYADIKGSPYLYKDFMYSTFFDSEGTQYKSELLNYNGYENTFEVIRDGKQYNFKVSLYDSIAVHPNKNDSLKLYESFVKRFSPNNTSFTNVVYYGKNIQLIRKFRVEVNQKVTETPGATIKTKRFADYANYSLVMHGETNKIRLKKSDIINKLGYKSAIQEYIKQENLSMNKVADVKKLLRYYENNLQTH